MKKAVFSPFAKIGLVLGVLFAGTGAALATLHKPAETLAYYTPSQTYEVSTDLDAYYSSLNTSTSGTDFLGKLRSFNLDKRKKTTGYGAGGTSVSNSTFIYTDYDPTKTATDGNGQVYGTQILSFYSGKSVTSFNKEHVWPDSHGGNKVEADIFMARPTIAAENSNRGNSFYVEGMCHDKNGWDPWTAFGDNIGCYQNEAIRGECARIIFYCCAASDALHLETNNTPITFASSATMGNLADMLKWNALYPVNEREIRRQDGGQYLQGNRNPFVDHPEWAAKIWADYDEKTRAVVDTYGDGSGKQVSSLSISGTPTKATYMAGEAFDPKGLTVTAHFVDATTEDVTAKAEWTPNPLTKGATSVTATYRGKTASYSGITVGANPLVSISISGMTTEYRVGKPVIFDGVCTATFQSGLTADVSKNVVLSGADTSAPGQKTVTVSFTSDGITKTAQYDINVVENMNFEIASSIEAGDKVILACNTAGVTAGPMSSNVLSSVSSTFSQDKKEITEYAENTIIFTIGGSVGQWTFANESGELLGATAAKKLDFDNGKTRWKVTFSGTQVTMTNETSSYGSMYYNTGAPRFTTYTSPQTAIQIYKRYGAPAEATAEAFASSILSKTNGICASSYDNRTSLTTVWASLTTEWGALSSSEQTKFTEADSTASTTLGKGAARYDYIAAKYGFQNFAARSSATPKEHLSMLSGFNAGGLWIFIGIVLGGAAIITPIAIAASKKKQRRF